MLGVLKRRLKPKRAVQNDNNQLLDEKSRLANTPVRHQVHPVCDEKAQLLVAYDHHNQINNQKRESKRSPTPESNASPPPYPKRASLDSNLSPTYPLAPNICVEGGRIEFIKLSPDGDTCLRHIQSTPPATPVLNSRITVTRGQQTEFDDLAENEFSQVKDRLESKILELEAALLQAQKTERRDKQEISKLQKQLAKREATQRDADRERRLRADSESKTKQALQEAARCRSRLKLLTSEFSRMEETVRSMLVYKKQADQLKQEKTALTIAFENRCQQYQNTIQRLNQEIFSLRQQVEAAACLSSESTQALLLQKHVEESRKQYERCLDDVANQVVRALVTQKGLKEEVSSLNGRIIELESQNSTLTTMLVQQLQHTDKMTTDHDEEPSRFGLEPLSLSSLPSKEEDNTSADVSPLMKSSVSLKHCNSFNSEVLDDNTNNTINQSNSQTPTTECDNKNNKLQKLERHLSTGSDVLDSRLSLEDKKRHQVLTKLWTELKGAEVTPKRLIEALSAVDSALWVPPQRPVSLNLQLPILQAGKYRRTRPVLIQTASKSEEETGNESPESGNRDEGYSTMSSDVQAEVSRAGNGDNAGTRTTAPLEELKEATDETDIETRLIDNKEPDIFYIPINLLNLKPRNSFPPGKDFLPFQHIMRSCSDSHLCIKITTAPSPCYSFSSPISSTPSILLLDITDRNLNPLRRTKATTSLVGNHPAEDANNKQQSPQSWSSIDDRVECSTWDAEYIQHWLRLDETRSTLQQQHRDLFELEYDKTELEDWSLSLSNEDVRGEQQWKKEAALTPGQYSLSTLPSIQENNALELEEDSSECLWNSSSYMVDHEGHEYVTLLMDAQAECQKWPYAVNYQLNLNTSPDNSWSSGGSDYCHEQETCSKRSSAALSGCSDDTGELPMVGTDFTRDFYRLVKFESTKSLASTSSRSVGGALSENGERETALQNVLTFIAEQQKYVQCRESPSTGGADATKEFNIEAPPQTLDESKPQPAMMAASSPITDNENYVTLKQLTELDQPKIAYAEEMCLVMPLDVEMENCSNMTEMPLDICASEVTTVEEGKSLSESFTSSVSTPETIVSKIPLRRKQSKIPVSPAKSSQSSSKLPKSKIPHRTSGKHNGSPNCSIANGIDHRPISASTPTTASDACINIIEGPPHRAISFHERATSKDVIDELNRMIRNGDENSQDSQENLDKSIDVVGTSRLDEGCMATGWVHVEQNVDLDDPKARASLLDVMMASVSSDSSPSSSCGGSVSSESMEEPLDYGQLHKIHRYHRQKKAHATRPELAVVRACAPQYRPSIIGRQDFFVRYGDKEKEAVASFDFLDELCTSGGSSLNCSVDECD